MPGLIIRHCCPITVAAVVLGPPVTALSVIRPIGFDVDAPVRPQARSAME
jgi:hypothetical protein